MDAFVIENILHEPNGYKRLVLEGDEPDKVVDFRTFKRCGFIEGGFYFVDEHGICQFSGVDPRKSHSSKPEPKSAPVPASEASKKPSSTPKPAKGSKKKSGQRK
jgi:hypothetical protein